VVFNPVGFFCAGEITLLTAMATLSVLLLLAKLGMNLWRRHRLVGAVVATHAALGERMYAAGIDDGALGAKINSLDEQLRRAEAFEGSSRALKAARRQLVLQLAAAALEDDGPLPGADAEYHEAREAQAALDRHEKGVDARRTPGMN
jgi:transcription elongation GreA/GreB family factor